MKKSSIFIGILFFITVLFFVSCKITEFATEPYYNCGFSFEISNNSIKSANIEVYSVFSYDRKSWSKSLMSFASNVFISENLKENENKTFQVENYGEGLANDVYVSFLLKVDEKYYLGFDKNSHFSLNENKTLFFNDDNTKKDNIYQFFITSDNNENVYFYKSSENSNFVKTTNSKTHIQSFFINIFDGEVIIGLQL